MILKVGLMSVFEKMLINVNFTYLNLAAHPVELGHEVSVNENLGVFFNCSLQSFDRDLQTQECIYESCTGPDEDLFVFVKQSTTC